MEESDTEVEQTVYNCEEDETVRSVPNTPYYCQNTAFAEPSGSRGIVLLLHLDLQDYPSRHDVLTYCLHWTGFC